MHFNWFYQDLKIEKNKGIYMEERPIVLIYRKTNNICFWGKRFKQEYFKNHTYVCLPKQTLYFDVHYVEERIRRMKGV